MRQISSLIRFIARALFNKETISYELALEDEYSGTDLLHKELLSLLDQGKINQAENLLFENLDRNNKAYIELALDFYRRLNELDDDYLNSRDFSREEIRQGLEDLMEKFGLTNIIL